MLRSRAKSVLRGIAVGATRGFVALLPLRLAVILKEHLQVVEKLDYEKHDIFLAIHSGVEHAIRTHSCQREPETIA